jgi:multimeric flavodoxin WrbA
MNVLIMNGSKGEASIDSRVSEIMSSLSEKGHNAKELLLRDMNYSPCRGCFNCWVKTPGHGE